MSKAFVIIILCVLSITVEGQKLKIREISEFKGDTLVYQKIERKSNKVIFSEYYLGNEPVSVWLKFDTVRDSIITFNYNFPLTYIQLIPKNTLILSWHEPAPAGISFPIYDHGVDIEKAKKSKINYPLFARRLGYQGTVEVLFKIESTGNGYPLGIIKSVVPELDKEAIRMLRELNKWKPAIKDGDPIDSHFIMKVVFKLNEPSLR